MTPAQRKYDQDLAVSMRNMAERLARRSRKISDTLKLAAERLEALSMTMTVEQPPAVDQHGRTLQPASQPDRANQLEPVRD